MKKKKDPNPGTKEAIAAGCKCPVMDNHYGAGYGGQKGVFAYNQDCEIHGWKKEESNDNFVDKTEARKKFDIRKTDHSSYNHFKWTKEMVLRIAAEYPSKGFALAKELGITSGTLSTVVGTLRGHGIDIPNRKDKSRKAAIEEAVEELKKKKK